MIQSEIEPKEASDFELFILIQPVSFLVRYILKIETLGYTADPRQEEIKELE